MIKIKKRIGLEQFINRSYPTIRQGVNQDVNVDENGCPIQPLNVDIEGYINQNPKYGKIDKSFIVFPIFFRQIIDDMGLYTDEAYEEADNLINQAQDPYKRLTGLPVENYYTFNGAISSGLTESQLERVESYNQTNPYIVDLNVDDLPSKGFTGVISFDDESVTYVIGGEVDNTGDYISNTGVIYETFFNRTRIITDAITGELVEILVTTFKYFTKGYKDYNVDLFANIKEDKYLGVVFPPQVDNDVFVDRGTVNVMERHLKMSEIDSVEQLAKYGQGFYNITKT